MTSSIKERPILFSCPMSLAIRERRKTQTRRVINPQPQPNGGKGLSPIRPYRTSLGQWNWVLSATGHGCGDPFDCPYGQPGDRLWVKEASWAWGRWIPNGETDTGRKKFRFEAVGRRVTYDRPESTVKRDGTIGWVFRHARYMPRSACRIVLEVTEVRLERLHEITEADARKEGFGTRRPMKLFRELWGALNGPRGFGWETNPFVFAIEFKVIEGLA